MLLMEEIEDLEVLIMKKRIISAIIMVLIFVPILIKGDIWFTGLMTILSLFGLYEIIHVRDRKNKIPVYMKLVAYLFTLVLCLNIIGDGLLKGLIKILVFPDLFSLFGLLIN